MKCWFLLTGFAVMVAPVLAAPKSPDAGTLLTSKDAVVLVGGPLDEVSKYESKPDAQNGHDHNTICGYFPKGYRLAEAERPPERGMQLSLHRFKTPKEARKFYDLTADAEREMTKMAGSPSAGSKVEVLKGVGEAGVLSIKKLTPEPKAIYQVGVATFLKGSVMGQLTVWKRDAAVAAAATTGAKQVAARLP
jgi:hypothetical protein